MIKIKDGIDFEILRNFGFKKGKEWADAGERCLQGIGYQYQHEWWHKFKMDEEDNDKIDYISDEYDIPCVQITVRTEEHLRDIYIDVAVEGTYHVGGSDLDVISETIMDLTKAGIIERKTDTRISDDYVKEVSSNYWTEEDEMDAGTHPTQVRDRIEKYLAETKVEFTEITFLDWSVGDSKVKVSLDNKVYGIFDYEKNHFI